MPRVARRIEAGKIYHVFNRGVQRAAIFDGDDDFRIAETLMLDAKERHPVRVYAYCLMPNHWHMLVQPLAHDALSKFIATFTRAHASILRLRRDSVGDGYVYQGRYKSFEMHTDQHVKRVARYIERNALTARMVKSAEHWYYCSLYQRQRRSELARQLLSPLDLPSDWVSHVNAAIEDKERVQFNRAIRTGLPLGVLRRQRKPKGSSESGPAPLIIS